MVAEQDAERTRAVEAVRLELEDRYDREMTQLEDRLRTELNDSLSQLKVQLPFISWSQAQAKEATAIICAKSALHDQLFWKESCSSTSYFLHVLLFLEEKSQKKRKALYRSRSWNQNLSSSPCRLDSPGKLS